MKRILLVSLILGVMLLSACGQSISSLATTPYDVAQYVEVGMDIDHVVDSIDPVYGNEAVYSVNCEYLSAGETIAFIPIQESTSFSIWFFMPQEGRTKPTAVGFQYDSEKDTDVVIILGQFDYAKIESVVNDYGTRVIWGNNLESLEYSSNTTSSNTTSWNFIRDNLATYHKNTKSPSWSFLRS